MLNTLQYTHKITLTLIFIALAAFSTQPHSETIKEKKAAFFKHIYPLIELENIAILETRKKINTIQESLATNKPLRPAEKTLLNNMADKYNLLKHKDDATTLTNKLLIKIDIIPPSLAIAQSANESAWGKSRFALKANNYFGQWCFSKGCGIVPSQRSANSKHEVRRFKSVQASVRSYIKNINTTRAYSGLRKIRHQLRLNKAKPSGLKLAQGLLRYSSRGKEYVKEIRSMIKYNKLKKYDEKFWAVVKLKKL